jgi:DNA-binding transcriptional regulator of glucitol operon
MGVSILFGKKSATEGSLKDYEVIYLGGHPSYPKKKAGGITFSVMPDSFFLQATMGSKNWFQNFKIPYESISKFEIVQRTVSTVEGLLGGVNSKQLNQANNIHITYEDETEIVLRLEMLTGVTVMGQAQKCNELMDFLKINGILDKFISKESTIQNEMDVTSQLQKLSELNKQGIITDDEFTAKKKQLLGI